VAPDKAHDMQSNANNEQITYADSGVDTAEGAHAVEVIRNAVRSTYRPEVIGDIGGFGGLFSAMSFKDMTEPILVSGTDGVGTKLALAQKLGKHDTVGIDLVAMCVNDILVTGAEPLFFLDYIAIGKLNSDLVGEVVSGIAEGCRQANCSLIGGEMAEHPGTMSPEDYDLSGFCVGVVDKPKAIDGKALAAGDAIIGLASSGIHSNGYSLVRKVLVEGNEANLDRTYDELGGQTLGEALLTPTRIYVKSIQALLASGIAVKAMAHITGGGISENLNRALHEGVDAQVEKGSWPEVPIIEMACEAARLNETERFKTFNMGIGFMVMVDASDVEKAMSVLKEQGEAAYHIGQIIDGHGEVTYR